MTSIPAVSFSERYPLNVELANGRVFELRLMGKADRDDVIAFGRLRGDVPSLAVDITNPRAIDQWIRDIEAGRSVTILAREAGAHPGPGSARVGAKRSTVTDTPVCLHLSQTPLDSPLAA